MKTLVNTLAILTLCGAMAGVSRAATVTVNMTSGDYATLQEALANVASGDDWGDGDDTILLDDDQVTLVSEGLQLPTKNGGVITLKNADGASPVIAADPNQLPLELMTPVNNGLHVIEGMTFLGPAGTSGVQTAIECEATTETDEIEILIRNCVVTRNNGSNEPVTNWGSEDLFQLTGICDRALFHGGDNFGGKLDVTIEGCTFAFARGGVGIYGNVEWGGSPVIEGAPEDAHRNLTIRNTLIIMGRSHGVSGRDIFEETTISIVESAILKHQGRGMRYFINDFGIAHTLNIRDSVIAENLNEAQIAFANPGFAGTCTLERVTLVGENTAGVFAEAHQEGEADFSFTDVIFDSPVNSFRILPDGTNPNSFVVSNCAAFTVNDGNGDSIKNAFAALYDDTGPLTEDPEYASTDLSVLDGVVGWYRDRHTLYDVGNDAYLGKGTPGGRPLDALAGGTDHANATINATMNWHLLE